jgi:acetolactate synthase-1/3 small subunit
MARTTPQKKHNKQKFEHHIYSLLVENKFGVLSRVSGLFARRGFNIYSLAVNPTEDDAVSRMTIVVDALAQPLEQVTKQLNKLIPIIKINEIGKGEGVERELVLITAKCDSTSRAQISELASIFKAIIVEVGIDTIMLELSGTPESINAFTDLVEPFGIIELQRTGRIALPKLKTHS